MLDKSLKNRYYYLKGFKIFKKFYHAIFKMIIFGENFKSL